MLDIRLGVDSRSNCARLRSFGIEDVRFRLECTDRIHCVHIRASPDVLQARRPCAIAFAKTARASQRCRVLLSHFEHATDPGSTLSGRAAAYVGALCGTRMHSRTLATRPPRQASPSAQQAQRRAARAHAWLCRCPAA